MGRKGDVVGTESTIASNGPTSDATAPTIGSTGPASDHEADVGNAATFASVTGTPQTLHRGATLGRYVVLDKLGGGGMGVVYAAYDPELDRKIAIKLLRASAAGRSLDGRTRLLREAQALARLSHPNVIAVHDVGEIDDQVFVAMEHVEGETLHAWRQREQRTWPAIRDVYLQAGRGLAAAHAVGIVHRDFKPDNVLIGADGRVRVLDFGLARAQETLRRPDPAMKVEHAETLAAVTPGLSTPLTSAGEFLGTPAYSSPEQLQGELAGAKSDQFSFCVALYEAAYGERPYRGNTFGQLVASVLAAEISPPPPGSRVPARTRAILLRGLRGDPEQRYASMNDLLADLAYDPARARRQRAVAVGALAVAGAVVYAAAVHSREPRELCTGARGRLAGAWDEQVRGDVARAFLATGKAFAPGAFHGAEQFLDGYADRWAAMSTDACEATRVRGEQSEELLDLREFCLARQRADLMATTQLLAHADAKTVQDAATMVRQLPPLEDCADTVQLRAVVKPPRDVATRARVDELERAIATAHQLGEAETTTEAAKALPTLEAVQAVHYRPLEARFLLIRGLIEDRALDFTHATTSLTDGILAAESAGDDKLAIEGWLDVMGNLYEQRKVDEAQRAGRHAASLIERIGGHPRFEAKLLVHQGMIEQQNGRSGWSYFDRALALRRRSLPPDDPDLLESLEQHAQKAGSEHRHNEALAEHEQVLAARERLYGPDGPLVAWSLFWIGSYQRRLADHHKAIATLTRALSIYDRAQIDAAAGMLFVLQGLAHSEAKLGRFDPALAHARRAVAIAENIPPAGQTAELAQALTMYSTVLRMQGDNAEAAAQSERVLRVVDGRVPPHNGLFVLWLTNLGLARLEGGRVAEALAPLERAVAIADAIHDTWNGDQPAQAHFALARALRALGKDEPRARSLAASARAFWVAWGPGRESEIAEVDSFLAASTASP
jgi:tetratricopeptide (TPR) repeat protein